MFSEEKFDQVCTDLNNALKREEEIQEFLENQKVEIEKMDDRFLFFKILDSLNHL